ncbi:MAG: hypothetical protein CMM08_01810, partial [Rhodospirillaceae bacterium]|nr:hypothetical protein [Rhodospirillaceae bacterium]
MTEPVFVTGGTGFLGSFFVVHLLRQGIPVFALIREPLEAKLIPNLWEAVGHHHRDAELPLELLHGVQGDVRQAGFGMDSSTYAELRSSISDIWHFAAAFETSGPNGDDVRDTNVTGTRHVLELAAQNPDIAVKLVSTAFAAPFVDETAREYLSEPNDLNRHSPDSLLVRGNHSTVPPSRERDHFRGRLIT